MMGKEAATSPRPSPCKGEGEALPADKQQQTGEPETQPGKPSPRGAGRVRGVEFARALRRRQTPHEQKVWSRLRNRRLSGFKFRRQHPIGPFIVDFYCAEARLVVELDGGGHMIQIEYDQYRTDWLQSRDIHVIRFTNTEVDQELVSILEKITEFCTDAQISRMGAKK